MIRRLFPVVMVVVLSAGVAQAGTLAISFNDTTAQVTFDQMVRQDAWGKSAFGLRGFYSDRHNTGLFSGGMNVLGAVKDTGLEVGAGIRGYYIDADQGDDMLAGALGGLVRFVPPGFTKVSLTGSLFYCPKVFTGLDGERLLDTEVKAAYKIIPRASVFISYTTIRAKFENEDARNLDNSIRGGLSLKF